MVGGDLVARTGDFWTIREEIARNLTHTLNQTMYAQTHVLFPQLQLLEVDFSTPYEDMIENIQLQVLFTLLSALVEAPRPTIT